MRKKPMYPEFDGIGEGGTPAKMPCCQVFEPMVQSGHHLASLGFSAVVRTCTPKPGKAPVLKLLGQRISSNHEHGRGNSFSCYSPTFTYEITPSPLLRESNRYGRHRWLRRYSKYLTDHMYPILFHKFEVTILLHAVIQCMNQVRGSVRHVMQQFGMIPFQFHMVIGYVQGS